MASQFIEWTIKYQIPVKNILHIGAHLVQEREDYNSIGAKKVYWVEAMPWIAEESKKLLELYPNQKLFCTFLRNNICISM
jgi:hypothetical protein